VGELAATFGVDWAHLGAQVISFSIVCALLYWLAYQPVLAMLEARRQQIAQGLENTAKINAKLAAIDGERLGILQAARTDAAALVADARALAARVKEQEARKAASAAEHVLRQARDAAAQEHVRMLVELRLEVGHLVVETTAAVAGRVLTADDQRRLADAAVRHLA